MTDRSQTISGTAHVGQKPAPHENGAPQSFQGQVVCLFAYDVANEIKTAGIQEILTERAQPFEIRIDRTTPKSMRYYKPLVAELPPPRLQQFNEHPVRLQVRVYDCGVITVSVIISFDKHQISDLMPYHNVLTTDGAPLGDFARDICDRVRAGLSELLVDPIPTHEPESYTVFAVTGMDGVTDVPSWVNANGRAIAGLLTETTPAALSDTQVTEIMRIQRAFQKDDTVVIDWDAAFVVDLSGYVDDIVYVLELANLQLEEFRALDNRLDGYLNQAFIDFEKKRFGSFIGFNRKLGVLREIRIDVTKLNDEVTHISKFIGDWFLARVYLGARERFYLDQWRSSVDHRLAQLDQLYSVVHAEANERKMLWLETAIVLLFVIDIIALFWGA